MYYLGRLPDPVADLWDFIESRVGPEGELSAGDVVADGGGDHDHGDAELGVLVPGLVQLQGSLIALSNK